MYNSKRKKEKKKQMNKESDKSLEAVKSYTLLKNKYRKLQNDFHKYVTSKGFDLER